MAEGMNPSPSLQVAQSTPASELEESKTAPLGMSVGAKPFQLKKQAKPFVRKAMKSTPPEQPSVQAEAQPAGVAVQGALANGVEPSFTTQPMSQPPVAQPVPELSQTTQSVPPTLKSKLSLGSKTFKPRGPKKVEEPKPE